MPFWTIFWVVVPTVVLLVLTIGIYIFTDNSRVEQ